MYKDIFFQRNSDFKFLNHFNIVSKFNQRNILAIDLYFIYYISLEYNFKSSIIYDSIKY